MKTLNVSLIFGNFGYLMILIMGDRRGACRVLVGWPEGKRPPGKPRRRWEEDIKKGSSRFGVGRQELNCSVSG